MIDSCLLPPSLRVIIQTLLLCLSCQWLRQTILIVVACKIWLWWSAYYFADQLQCWWRAPELVVCVLTYNTQRSHTHKAHSIGLKPSPHKEGSTNTYKHTQSPWGWMIKALSELKWLLFEIQIYKRQHSEKSLMHRQMEQARGRAWSIGVTDAEESDFPPLAQLIGSLCFLWWTLGNLAAELSLLCLRVLLQDQFYCEIANTFCSVFKIIMCYCSGNVDSYKHLMNWLWANSLIAPPFGMHRSPFISTANILLTDILIKTNMHELSNERLI